MIIAYFSSRKGNIIFENHNFSDTGVLTVVGCKIKNVIYVQVLNGFKDMWTCEQILGDCKKR